jgi:hypothetical protein
MNSNRVTTFAIYVWDAADHVGRSAPRIVDAILNDVFPATSDAAETEGATKILRKGCIAEVKRILHTVRQTDGQTDFEQIDPSFMPLIRRLQRPSYFVPELDVEVPVSQLIAEPVHLDAARHFMRGKGMECLAEADRLDRLYQAVAEKAGVPRLIPAIHMVPSNIHDRESEVAA